MLTLHEQARTHHQPHATAQLHARIDQLEAELQALRAFVSHDIRSPLTSIVGFAELLLERQFTPEKQRQLIGYIQREGVRLDALLDEMPGSGR